MDHDDLEVWRDLVNTSAEPLDITLTTLIRMGRMQKELIDDALDHGTIAQVHSDWHIGRSVNLCACRLGSGHLTKFQRRVSDDLNRGLGYGKDPAWWNFMTFYSFVYNQVRQQKENNRNRQRAWRERQRVKRAAK